MFVIVFKLKEIKTFLCTEKKASFLLQFLLQALWVLIMHEISVNSKHHYIES